MFVTECRPGPFTSGLSHCTLAAVEVGGCVNANTPRGLDCQPEVAASKPNEVARTALSAVSLLD
jgi:hypothetical protein